MTTRQARGRRLGVAWFAMILTVLAIANGYEVARQSDQTAATNANVLTIAKYQIELLALEKTVHTNHNTSYPLLVAMCKQLHCKVGGSAK